jgi:acetolactate synthase I/III small subunit
MLDIMYTLLLEVRDQPGVLVRVAQVFARRGSNISAIHVEHPHDTTWAHMTIIVKNVARIDQITSQLEKLIDVHSVAVTTTTKES